MNLPNKLTMLRLILIPVFVVFVFLEVGVLARFNNFIAFGIFAIASFTDYLDGHIARKYNMVTDFGKLFDSAADKLLCGSALMLLIYMFAAGGAFAVCITVFSVGHYLPRAVYDGVPLRCCKQRDRHRRRHAG